MARVDTPTTRHLDLLTRSLDELPGGRTIAARVLARHPHEPARAALERVLRDPSRSLAGAATTALCRLGLTPSLGALEGLLATDSDHAATILRNLSGDEALPLSERTASTGPTGIRCRALDTVTRISVERGCQVAKQLAVDPNPRVRAAAFKLLATHDSPGWLQTWASDPVAWVAEGAAAFQHVE